MKIKFISEILDNGEIKSIRLPQGANNPEEGYNDETQCHIVYIRQEIDNKPKFMETHYYSFLSNSFVQRPEKPNRLATWENGEWVCSKETFLTLVRPERDKKLFLSDWTQMPDSPLTTEEKLQWARYRQALRDFPSTINIERSLEHLQWPPQP